MNLFLLLSSPISKKSPAIELVILVCITQVILIFIIQPVSLNNDLCFICFYCTWLKRWLWKRHNHLQKSVEWFLWCLPTELVKYLLGNKRWSHTCLKGSEFFHRSEIVLLDIGQSHLSPPQQSTGQEGGQLRREKGVLGVWVEKRGRDKKRERWWPHILLASADSICDMEDAPGGNETLEREEEEKFAQFRKDMLNEWGCPSLCLCLTCYATQ